MTLTSKTRFVITGRPELDNIVAQDVAMVTHAVRDEIGEVDSIILEGSYGRGEGAMIQRDGRWMPVNDYDFCVVTDKVFSPESRETVRRKVLSGSDIWRVDLASVSRKQLRGLKPRMLYFDRKYGSQVVHGDPGVLDLIPAMRPESIPLFESEKEFYARMISFILSFQTCFLKRSLSDDETYLLRQQISKSLIACANSKLFIKGEYCASIVERERLFEEAAVFNPASMELIRGAFQFKASPYRKTGEDLVPYYFQCRDFYLKCFRELLNVMYRREFNSWTSYGRAYLYYPRNIAIRFRARLKKDPSCYRNFHLALAQLFLVEGLRENGTVREEQQALVQKHLSNVSGKVENRVGWDGLREAILSLRM